MSARSERRYQKWERERERRSVKKIRAGARAALGKMEGERERERRSKNQGAPNTLFDYQTVFVHVAFLFLSSASIPIHLVSTTRPQAANKKVIEYRLLRNISTYNYYATPRISTCVVHAMMYGLLGRFP